MKDFKPGTHVQFVEPLDYGRWSARKTTGTVVESRQYGPVEPMVTVDFGNVRVHVPGSSLRIVNDR